MQLFKHQEEGIKFLTNKKKAILADQMGLGKTRQAIVAAMNVGQTTLVLCPASLKTNWAREIVQVDPFSNIKIVGGTVGEDYHKGPNGAWLIVNYDIVSKDTVQKILKSEKFDTVILDEAHYIKSQKSKRTKTTLALIKGIKNCYLLTGTPIMNRPEELFTLLKAIDHPLGANWYNYVFRYCGAFLRQTSRAKFLDTSGATNLQELKKKIEPSYLRRTKEILGDTLPAKIISNVPVQLSREDKNKYATAWDEYLEFLKNNPVVFSDMTEEERAEKMENILQARHLVELQKLKQVTSQAKVLAICEDVENIVEQGEKVIIFTQYTETLRKLRAELKTRGIMAVTLSGEDDQTARQLSIDAFQKNAGVKVFIGNTMAAGVGITLTEASIVIFADLSWTPALHDQAMDRAHRIGQQRQVNVYFYIAQNTIEEDIFALLEKKSEVISTILEGKKKRTNNVSVANQLLKKLYENNIQRTS